MPSSIHPEDTWPLPGKQLDATCSTSWPTTVARLDHLSRWNRNCQWHRGVKRRVNLLPFVYRPCNESTSQQYFTFQLIGETLISYTNRWWRDSNLIWTRRNANCCNQFVCEYWVRKRFFFQRRKGRAQFRCRDSLFFLSLFLYPFFFFFFLYSKFRINFKEIQITRGVSRDSVSLQRVSRGEIQSFGLQCGPSEASMLSRHSSCIAK